MGVDKALLIRGGKPLWERQLEVLRDLAPRTLAISASARPLWMPDGVPLIVDATPACGPLSGVTAALEALEDTHLVVLAVDMPGISAAGLRPMLAAATPDRGVIPRKSCGGWEPLCAIYPRAAANRARAILSQPGASLQRLADVLLSVGWIREFPVSPQEKDRYESINTPGDWARFQASGGIQEKELD